MGIDSVHLFHGINDKSIKDLIANCSYRNFKRGEIVITKGSTNTDALFVISGQVAVFNYVDDACQVFLSEYFEGDLFGELASIDESPRSAWVIAGKDCTVAHIPGEVFLDTVVNHPGLALNLLRHFSRVIRGGGERLRNLSILSSPQRVCLEMVRLAGAEKCNSGEAIIGEMPSHSALASFSSTTKEVVVETLGELMRKGLLVRQGRSMKIFDINKFRRLVNDSEYQRLDCEEGVQSLFKEIYESQE